MISDIIAGFLSGLLGAMGFGGGGILILYLTLFKDVPQIEAQGINLIFFIPTAITAVIMHAKNHLIQWKISVRMILTGISGLAVGYMIILNLSDKTIRKIFAFILIFTGIKQLFSKNKS